jgi:hypothetical protein
MEGAVKLVHLSPMMPWRNSAAQRRARELLAANPEILNIVMRAQSNGILEKALHDCMGNPKAFGRYWDDPIVGPILSELKRGL